MQDPYMSWYDYFYLLWQQDNSVFKGVPGRDGRDGRDGLQGPQGLAGGIPAYAYIFSVDPQTFTSDDTPVKFTESFIPNSAANVILLTPPTVTLTLTGDYLVRFQVSAVFSPGGGGEWYIGYQTNMTDPKPQRAPALTFLSNSDNAQTAGEAILHVTVVPIKIGIFSFCGPSTATISTGISDTKKNSAVSASMNILKLS